MTRANPLTQRMAAAALAAALLLAAPPARAVPVARSPLKQLQMRRLAQEPMHERAEKRERRELARERLRELRRLARQMRAGGQASLRVRGERARPGEGDPDERPNRAALTPARVAEPSGVRGALSPPRPNVRCNNPAADGATDGQCETSIARWNNFMLAAWNDGTGFTDLSNQTQGWATSVDGGVTWVDQGTLPIPAAYASSWKWTSDPVLTVNAATGAFYYSGLADATAGLSAIGVIKGRFTGSTFAWGTPSAVRTVASNVDYLDKEWIALDPVTGKVCVSYTRFPSNISRIEFQFADSSLAAWSTPVTLSPTEENGAVQGSRPIVAADGTVYVVYYLIGVAETDSYRICRSTDGGVSFTVPNDALAFYPNFGTGAPGFNREQGIQFPSIAIDRSGGPHDGRLYLAWAESMNWLDDAPNVGIAGRATEAEPNDVAAQAMPLTLGQAVTGTVSATSDLYDYYSIHLAAGQGVILSADTLATGMTITMRLFATDGSTRLAYTQATSSDIAFGFTPVMMFAAPTAGNYIVRVAAVSGSGAYRLGTGAATRNTERGRDQRDVFVSTSDDHGASWSTPTPVSQSPAGFDDWLPEVAVAGDGQAYCAWYDFRDATASTCGGESNVYLARSSDGGATWAELGSTSDAKTAWTGVNTNIIPNQGDYLSLFADGAGLVAAWSDGRAGNPDVYMSSWLLSEASVLPALVSATLANGQATLRWSVGSPAGFAAELYRRRDGAAWDSLGTLRSDAAGHLQYTDAGVEIGHRYDYRLGVVQGGTEYFYGQATIQVTGTLALERAWPNPVTPTSVVTFTLPAGGTATLDLLDLGGRRISSRDLGSLGAGVHTVPLFTGPAPRPGMYFLRLSQGDITRSRRIVVL